MTRLASAQPSLILLSRPGRPGRPGLPGMAVSAVLALAWSPGCTTSSGGDAESKGERAQVAGTQPDAASAGGTKTDSASAGEAETDPAGAGEAGREEADSGGRGTGPSVDVVHAQTVAATSGKGAKSLGFQLKKLTHLFALAATAEAPAWAHSPEGADPALTRDDDLNTAWQCDFKTGVGVDEAGACVLGLAMPGEAKVEVVRVYVGAGPRYRDYVGHPRVKTVRLHTDEGYVDATLSDGANHAYIRLAAPILTRSLAIEVLDVYAGKRDTVVHISEVEVYGTEATAREPLAFDPELAWTSWETDTWSGSGGGADDAGYTDYTIRQLFIEYAVPGQGPVDVEAGELPKTKRLSRATAVFGKSGDDFLLFERLHGTHCDSHKGSYVLYDRRNRMLYPLGELGGPGGEVYRQREGRGFAVGWVSEGRFTVKGVAEVAGELVWRRPKDSLAHDPAGQLEAWGFDPKPLGRGGDLEAPPTGCHRTATGQLAPLQSLVTLPEDADLDPSQWLSCDLGGSTLFVQGTCGSGAMAYLVGGGKLIGDHQSQDDRGFRVRRIGARALVELSEHDGDNSALFWVDSGNWLKLSGHAGLALRPPSGCDRCVDTWRDPEG